VSYDPNKISNIAKAFLLAAERCFEQKPLHDGQIQALLVPGIVCTAFSIELSLKAVLTIENKKVKKSHKLNDLYGKLSSDSQLLLQNKLPLKGNNLRNKLTEVSEVFKDWRYIYEEESIKLDIDFLKRLAVAAKDLAASKRNKG